MYFEQEFPISVTKISKLCSIKIIRNVRRIILSENTELLRRNKIIE